MASEEEYDYSALEEEARQVMLPEKYGVYGYMLSPEHGLTLTEDNQLEITGEFSFDIGYICNHTALWLYDRLLELGREPKLCKGQDSRKMFDHHYFVQDKDGEILDAVPWFKFKGEKHEIWKLPGYGDYWELDQSLSARYFLRLQEADDSLYMLCFEFPCNMKHELKSNKMRFEFSIFDVDAWQDALFDVTVNLSRYRQTFPEDYEGYTIEENAEANLVYLIDQGAIKKRTLKPDELSEPIDEQRLEELGELLLQSAAAELALIHKLAYMQLE